MNKVILTMLLLVAAISANAQVTIGSTKDPEEFSSLELVSGGNRGLRLPQLTTAQRNDLVFTGHETEALGLEIFNITIRCVETWNGLEWIRTCPSGGAYEIPDSKGGDTWDHIKWVGAFWKDDQTGERIIASKTTTPDVAWTAVVNDEEGTGAWLTLQANNSSDPNIWKTTPGDAESYQLPATRVTSISGTGDILFRIGATSTNPNATDAAYKYPNGSNGKAPRYATIKLTVGSTNYTLFCRQGESADYVLRNGDPVSGGTITSRTLAAKFSPYNLTDAALSDDVSTPVAQHQTAINGGKFVDYPTKAGAFWQWGTDKQTTSGTYTDFLRMAYHPTNPATDAVADWDSDYIYENANFDTWNEFTGDDLLETCPSGWRRPIVMDNSITEPMTTPPASGSELMQSLFFTTFDGHSSNANGGNYRYFGYYADGYFDRRPIENTNARNNTAVSVTTKDVAYIGELFTNPVTNASLFVPAVGRRRSDDGVLLSSGNGGRYWSSSTYDSNNGWYWGIDSDRAYQFDDLRTSGNAVRCVSVL
jgi:hypothetical protein